MNLRRRENLNFLISEKHRLITFDETMYESFCKNMCCFLYVPRGGFIFPNSKQVKNKQKFSITYKETFITFPGYCASLAVFSNFNETWFGVKTKTNVL
jgi:hypothetical protein